MSANTELTVPGTIQVKKNINERTMWHHRLGHAPMSKIEKIGGLKGLKSHIDEICVTCPMAKMTKQPFPSSSSRAGQPFELVHIEIFGWVKTSYKYFLTIVDDHTRVTWVHLLNHKSDSYSAIVNFVHMAAVSQETEVRQCIRV